MGGTQTCSSTQGVLFSVLSGPSLTAAGWDNESGDYWHSIVEQLSRHVA